MTIKPQACPAQPPRHTTRAARAACLTAALLVGACRQTPQRPDAPRSAVDAGGPRDAATRAPAVAPADASPLSHPLNRPCGPTGPENTAEACGNHLDDDCDGWIDCADNGCRDTPTGPCARPDVTPARECSPRGPENTDEACGNHLDDDCNGWVDCNDHSCVIDPVNVCGRPDGGLLSPDAGTARPAAARPAAARPAAARPAAAAR